MRIKLIAVSLISLFVLSSCSTPKSPAEIAAREARVKAENEAKQVKLKLISDSIPICVDEKDCKVKWDAAQVWVIHNSDFNIRTSTDVLLETYTASLVKDFHLIAVNVTKEPMGGGKYKIIANVDCATYSINSSDTSFVCKRDIFDATLDFNKTVRSIAP